MLRTTSLLLLFTLCCLPACGGGGGGGSSTTPTDPPAPTLTILEFSGATLTPAFRADLLTYSAAVPSSTDAVTFSASTNVGSAPSTISLNGTALGSGTVSQVLPLLEGANAFAVTLRSADGATIVTYSVTLTRAKVPVIDDLSVSGAQLNPAFSPDVISYTAEVGFLTDAAAVTASAAAGATLALDGAPLTSATPGAPVPLVVGSNTLTVRVTTDEGEARDYTITLQRQSVAQFAQSFRADRGGEFGGAVAISGDTMVVGNSSFANATGQVVVYTRSGETWTEQQAIDPLNLLPPVGAGLSPTTFDRFGSSVAISGDTLFVGAPGDNGPTQSLTNQGAVYIYTRINGVWGTQDAQVTRLRATSPTASDSFGESLAVSGNTLVVGASYEDSSTAGINTTANNNASASGAVYVFTRNEFTSVWTQQAYIKASGVSPGDRFGQAVALEGDQLVVGAPGEDNPAISSQNDIGAAFVFTRNGSTWSERAIIRPSDSAQFLSQNFATAVALSGDTLAVGVPLRDVSSANPNENSGGVFVYVGGGATWTEQAILDPSPNDANDSFGTSVALRGGVLVVGAVSEDSSSTGVNPTPNNSLGNSGAAYVFLRQGTTWTEQAFLKASDPSSGAQFGISVGLSDGRVAVGALGAGKAYVFR